MLIEVRKYEVYNNKLFSKKESKVVYWSFVAKTNYCYIIT